MMGSWYLGQELRDFTIGGEKQHHGDGFEDNKKKENKKNT